MNSAAIAFYNTENFFDTIDDPEKYENEYTPEGSRKWTQKRYENKVWKISSVISEIGMKETGAPPLFIGLAEIENDTVLKDLINSEHLVDFGYDFIHFDSPDERGIDNALLYRKEFIEEIKSEPIRLIYRKPPDFTSVDYSRDILYSKISFSHQVLHVFVVHLPSRRDVDVNREFRNQFLGEIRNRVNEVLLFDPDAQIVVMGDFNGNPNDSDAVEILQTTFDKEIHGEELYNPMMGMMYKTGSLKHEGRWILFDQILFTQSFLVESNPKLKFDSAHIYNDRSVQDWNRRFKGSPFRTYAGTKYLGGYSDHFPVYAILNY